MADWNEGCGDYAGGGETGQAHDRTYTATAGGKTQQFDNYNDAAQFVAQNHEPGSTSSVTTK